MEALWSQFENVMAKDPDADNEVQNAEEGSDNEREDELVVEEERAPRR